MVAALVSFIVLSILGIINSGYLVWKHITHKDHPLECPLNHDCSVVTESRWSKIFFVRNEVLGLLFYISMLAAILLTLFIPTLASTILPLLIIATGFGLAFSIFLVIIQIKVIKDYCFYCMLSALITLFLFINSFFL